MGKSIEIIEISTINELPTNRMRVIEESSINQAQITFKKIWPKTDLPATVYKYVWQFKGKDVTWWYFPV